VQILRQPKYVRFIVKPALFHAGASILRALKIELYTHMHTERRNCSCCEAYLGLWLRRKGGGRVWRWRPARIPAPPAANKLNFNTDAGAARRNLRSAKAYAQKHDQEYQESTARYIFARKTCRWQNYNLAFPVGKGWTQVCGSIQQETGDCICATPHTVHISIFPTLCIVVVIFMPIVKLCY